ncbi:hypothetical protein ES703_08866 [subsurface metagenome]
MIKRTSRNWIPFWGDKWLFGSMRQEFDVAERGIWWDLMPIAMKDEGFIRANKDTPYPIQQLAGMLIIPEDLLEKTIDKFIEKGKYTRLKNGTLYITNWNKYCFTDRHMRRLEEETEDEMSAEEDTMSENTDKVGAVADTRLEKRRVDKNREEKKGCLTIIEINQIIKELKTVKGLGAKKSTALIIYLNKLSTEFPDVDVVYEIKKKVAWWLDHPLTARSNVHLQLRNWFIISQKGFDEAKKQHRVGAESCGEKPKYPTSFLNSIYSTLQKQGKKSADYSKRIFDIDYYQAQQLAKKYKDSPAEFIKFLEGKK